MWTERYQSDATGCITRNDPTDCGYYFAVYFNDDEQTTMYKAIWYDQAGHWCGWRPRQRKVRVLRYVEVSRQDFYTECMGWADTRWTELVAAHKAHKIIVDRNKDLA